MPQPAEIPFPTSTFPGATQHEAAGRIVNGYAEPLGPSGPRKVVHRRSPGLSSFAQSGSAGWRDGVEANGVIYGAWLDGARTIAQNGAVSVIGALPGTKQVSWAKNNRRPTADVVAVDVDNGAFVVTTGGIASYSGGGALPIPNSVCFQDGYFFFTIGDRRVFASALNDTTINSQTFITAESRPGGSLLRGIAYKGLLFLFGSQWIEVWSDTAQAYPAFPYSRLSVLDRGLLTASAVAGWENGFGALHWVADDFGVYRFGSALAPEKVSPPDLDRLIQAADPTTLRAGCYVHGGHSFWSVSSDAWTWEFSAVTNIWNERASFAGDHSLGRWRGVGGMNAFGLWLVGDTQSGDLLSVDTGALDEAGTPMLFRLESAPVSAFPSQTMIARSEFEFSTGATTLPNAAEPQVAISWNDGAGWSNPLQRGLGRQGQGNKRVILPPTGRSSAQGRRWRIDVTDPVYVAFLGATQSTNLRAA